MSVDASLRDLVRSVAPGASEDEQRAVESCRRFLRSHSFPDANPDSVRRSFVGLASKLRVHGKVEHALALEACFEQCQLGQTRRSAAAFPALLLELSGSPLGLSTASLAVTRWSAPATASLPTNDDTPWVHVESDADEVAWRLERESASPETSDDEAGGEKEPSSGGDALITVLHSGTGAFAAAVASAPVPFAAEESPPEIRGAALPLNPEDALVDAVLEALLGGQQSVLAAMSPVEMAPLGAPSVVIRDPSYLVVARALGGVEAACRTIGGPVAEGIAHATGDWARDAAAATREQPHATPLSASQRAQVAAAGHVSPEAVVCALGAAALTVKAPVFAPTSVAHVQRLAAMTLAEASGSAAAHGRFIIGAEAALLPALVDLANDLGSAVWLCGAVLQADAAAASNCLAYALRAALCAVDPATHQDESAATAAVSRLAQALPLCCEAPLWGDVARQFARGVLSAARDVRGLLSAVQASHRDYLLALAAAAAAPGGYTDWDTVPPRVSLLGLSAWAHAQLQPTVALLRSLAVEVFLAPAAGSFPVGYAELFAPSFAGEDGGDAPEVAEVLSEDPSPGIGAESSSVYAAAVRRELARALARLSLNSQVAAGRAVETAASALDRALALAHAETPPSAERGDAADCAVLTAVDVSGLVSPGAHRLVAPVVHLPALAPLELTLTRAFLGALRPLLAKVDALVVEPRPSPAVLADLPVLSVDALRLAHRRAARWSGAAGEALTAALHGHLADLTAMSDAVPSGGPQGAPGRRFGGSPAAPPPLDPLLLLSADAPSAVAAPGLTTRSFWPHFGVDDDSPPASSGWLAVSPVPAWVPGVFQPHSLRAFGPGMDGSRRLAPGGDGTDGGDDPAGDALWYGAGALAVALHMREHRRMLQHIRSADEDAWLHGEGDGEDGDDDDVSTLGGGSDDDGSSGAALGRGVFARFGELEFDATFMTASRRLLSSLALGGFVEGHVDRGGLDALLEALQRPTELPPVDENGVRSGGADEVGERFGGGAAAEDDNGVVGAATPDAAARLRRRLFDDGEGVAVRPAPSRQVLPEGSERSIAPPAAGSLAAPAAVAAKRGAAAVEAAPARQPRGAGATADVRPINALARPSVQQPPVAVEAVKAKPVFGAGYMPLPGTRRSAWWDLDAQVDTKKDKSGSGDAGNLKDAPAAAPAPAAAAPPAPPPAPPPSRGPLARWRRRRGARGGLDFSAIAEEGEADVIGEEEDEVEDAESDDGGGDDESGSGSDGDARAGSLALAAPLVPAAAESAAGAPKLPTQSDIAVSGDAGVAAEAAVASGDGGAAPPVAESEDDAAPAADGPDDRRPEAVQVALNAPRDLAPAPAPAPRASAVWAGEDTPAALAAASWDALGLGTPDEWDAIAYLMHQPACAEPPDPAAAAALRPAQLSERGEGDDRVDDTLPRAPSLSLGCEPLAAVCRRDVTGVLRAQAALVSSALVAGFLASLHVSTHFWALRAVLFMEQELYVSGFTRPVLSALEHGGNGGLVFDSTRLTALLQTALAPLAPRPPRSVPGEAPSASAPQLTLRPAAFSCAFAGFGDSAGGPAAASPDAVVATGLRISYSVPYPLSALLSPAALDQYNAVFGQLLRVRRVLALAEGLTVDATVTERQLEGALRFAGPALDPYARALRAQLRVFAARRHALLLFLQSLFALVTHGVLGGPWEGLQARLAAVQSFEGLVEAHAAYLRACMGRCFLLDAQESAWRALHRVLQRAEAVAVAARALLAEVDSVARTILAGAARADAALRLEQGRHAQRGRERRSVALRSAACHAMRQLPPAPQPRSESERLVLELCAGVAAAVEHHAQPAFDHFERCAGAFQAHVGGLVRGVLQQRSGAGGGEVQHSATLGVPLLVGFVLGLVDFNGYYARAPPVPPAARGSRPE